MFKNFFSIQLSVKFILVNIKRSTLSSSALSIKLKKKVKIFGTCISIFIKEINYMLR